jgi:hypothetical protein
MPKASFSSLDANWTYPFRYFPIYAENQSISGIILCPASLAGKEARICISSFSIFDLLSTFQTQDQNNENETTIMEGNCTHVRLNGTETPDLPWRELQADYTPSRPWTPLTPLCSRQLLRLSLKERSQ